MTLAARTDPDLNLAISYRDRFVPPERHGKLGAHVGGGDPRFPMLRDYVRRDRAQVQVPAACDRSDAGFPYGMLANDQLGDCVIAAMYHGLMHMLLGAGRDVPRAEDLTPSVVATYSAVAGYVPGNPSTDGGTSPEAAWAYWQRPGIPLPGTGLDQVAGVVQVLPHDGANIRRAIYEFDAVGLSLAMPTAWQGADVWDAGGDPQSDPAWQPGGWGGHEVLAVGYSAEHIAVVTWGGIKLLTWRGFGTYGELALTQLSKDVLGAGGTSEIGVDYDALAADLPQL